MSRPGSIVCIGVLAAFLAETSVWPVAAHAHAVPQSEQPRVGSTVTAPPSEVTITYDAPIESLFSKLEVLNATGVQEGQGAPTVGPNHRTLSLKLKQLKPGKYTVKWSVVAEDGHRTEGSYEFTVAGGGS